jgi:hypothetical protein
MALKAYVHSNSNTNPSHLETNCIMWMEGQIQVQDPEDTSCCLLTATVQLQALYFLLSCMSGSLVVTGVVALSFRDTNTRVKVADALDIHATSAYELHANFQERVRTCIGRCYCR